MFTIKVVPIPDMPELVILATTGVIMNSSLSGYLRNKFLFKEIKLFLKYTSYLLLFFIVYGACCLFRLGKNKMTFSPNFSFESNYCKYFI